MSALPLVRTLVVIGSIVTAAACAPGNDAAVADTTPDTAAAPHEIALAAHDYRIEIPDTLSAGATTFRLSNQGSEPHHVFIVKLAAGKTMDDLLAETKGELLPDWAIGLGGPNAPDPGASSMTTVDLEPGSYAALCIIPSPDGVPHVAKGMSKQFTVVPAEVEPALPAADVVMKLVDYDFKLDKPLSTSTKTIRVETDAEQMHEIVMVKLMPGKSLDDFMGWIQKMDGPPPGSLIGGTVGLTKGQSNIFHVSLEPGDYAMICFLPDKKDHKPHFMHGMMRQFTVS